MPVNVVIGLGIAALGVLVVVGAVVVGRRRLARRRRLEPIEFATMELRDDPPPVVNLLVNEMQLTPDAVAATLLQLAVGRHLEVIEVSPEQVLLHRRHHTTRAPLSRPAQQLLEVVDEAGGGGDVSIRQLADRLRSERFHGASAFASAVRAQAVDRGLAEPAKGIAPTGTVMLGALVACVAIVVAAPPAAIVTPVLFVGLVLAAAFGQGLGNPLVPTALGREVGGRWLGIRRWMEQGGFEELPAAAVTIWDGYLAHAVALGEAPVASQNLVRQVTTELTMTDLAQTAGAVRALWKLRGDREAWADLHQRRHAEVFGPDVPATELFGPEPDDWWALLEVTGRAWTVAGLAISGDMAAWAAAARRRIDRLAETAPPEVAAPVATLRPSAHRWIDLMQRASRNGAPDGAAAPDPGAVPFASPQEQAAIDELVVAIAGHYGWEPTPSTVVAGLVGDEVIHT